MKKVLLALVILFIGLRSEAQTSQQKFLSGWSWVAFNKKLDSTPKGDLQILNELGQSAENVVAVFNNGTSAQLDSANVLYTKAKKNFEDFYFKQDKKTKK